jgi:hypothetical protein
MWDDTALRNVGSLSADQTALHPVTQNKNSNKQLAMGILKSGNEELDKPE